MYLSMNTMKRNSGSYQSKPLLLA